MGCWTDKQRTRYWHDLLHIALGFGHLGHRKHKTTHDNAHTLGKIITFEENKKITVIDGQQRLTTTIVILICIRNHLLKQQPKHALIRKINFILFRSKIPRRIRYSEGDHLSFVRFSPTYLDRACFYDLIFDKTENEKSNLFAAKTFFDAELSKYGKIDQIERIFDKLTTRFRFIYVGIPTMNDMAGSNVQHSIYQWFFEHEMFICKGGGDRPGYAQTVCDLFRNYALSFFINESMDEQKQIYKFWIKIEKSYADIHQLNEYLRCLVDNCFKEEAKKEKEAKQRQPGIKMFSAQMHALNEFVEPDQNMRPYDIYRKLVGYVEEQMKEFEEQKYKLFVYELLKCLMNKSDLCVHGYLRRIGLCDSDEHFIGEVAEMIDEYLPIQNDDSLRSICSDVKAKLKN